MDPSYRVEIEVNMSDPNWIRMATNALKETIKERGDTNVRTTVDGMTYKILVKQ